MKFYQIFIVYFIQQFILGQDQETSQTFDCGNGCLMCTANSTTQICQICDYKGFFIRYGFSCISNQDQLLNCAVTTDGKNCIHCESEYYLDSATKKCVKLETPIENCLYVSSDKKCLQCTGNNYVDENGLCQQIEKNIQNCRIYETGNTCKVCDNSVVSADKSQCESLNNSTNCAQYSGEIYCSKCNTGYRYLPNKYLVNLQIDSNFVREFNTKIITNQLNNQKIFSTVNDQCYKAVENCVEYGDKFNECKTCADGYYNSDNKFCYQNPKPKIDFCSEYTTETICKNCLSGYYLTTVENQTVCLKQKDIDNCQVYSRTVEGKCEECNPSFYYTQTTKDGVQIVSCVKRSNTISNCAVYQSDAELCKECRESYELSESKKLCVLQISKCQQHEFIIGSGGNESLICQKCLAGFYIKTNIIGNNITTSCELPQVLIEGCEIYQTENQCIGCKQNYYLANFQCHQHNQQILEQLVCKQKSILVQNDCSKCFEGQFLYKLYNYCAPISTNKIDKCEIYSNSNVCSQCENNYYYDTANKKCIEIIIPDCQELDKTSPKCIKCDLNKSLIPNKNSNQNKCVKIPDFLVSFCKDFQFDLAAGTVSCKECISGYYPRQFPKRFFSFCVFQTQLSDFRSGLNESNLTALSNCQAFDFSNKECLYCNQEQSNYLINGSTGECTSKCQNDEVAYTFYFQENNPYSFMKCITQNKVQNGNGLENCKRLDFDVSIKVSENSSSIPKYCVECFDDFRPQIDEETQTVYARFVRTPLQFVPNSTIKNKSYFSIWNKIPLIKQCHQFNKNSKLISYGALTSDVKTFVNGYNILNYRSEDADSDSIQTSFFQNARSLVAIQDSNTQINYYGIKTCQYGFTGVIVGQQNRLNDPAYSGFFLNQCSEFSSCNNNIFYTGLCNHDNNCDIYKYASCTACLDPTKILTIPYKIQPWMEIGEELDVNSASNVTPFKTALTQFTSSQKMNLINTCLKKGIINSSNAAFPNNCAVQLVHDKQLYQYTTDLEKTPNPVCIACKPMYKPTLSSTNVDNTNYKYIKSCSQITNCLESNEYNKCEVCNENYVLKYVADANNQWFSNADECVQNDIKGCLVGINNGVCKKCKKGYSLNQEGICDTVTNFEACEDAAGLSEYNDTYKHLNDYPFRLGCMKCKATMYSVIFAFSPEICVKNNSTLTHPIGKNFFIQNCQSYQYQYGKLICSVCVTGYYLTSDFQSCISEEISNCVIYRSEVNAQTKKVTYSCQKCKEKYYLEDNQCLPGKIQSCLQYSNKENCILCESGNIPTRILNNQYSICFNISKSVKGCLDFDLSEGQKGILKCNKCNNESYPFLFSLAIKTCAQYYQIDNCLEYSINNDFQNSSFFCVKCKQAFYALNTSFPSKCQPRSQENYPINNCLQYTSNADTCDQCISNFYLSANKKQCLPNPNGIKNCRLFKSQNECQQCYTGYYVFNKECKEIPKTDIVQNCFAYDTDLTCKQCDKGYFIVSNNCQKVVLQNCLEIGFDRNCDKCEDGYVFIQNECQKTNISNCLVYKTANTCKECEQLYYLANERCINADIITNCQKYVDKKKCGECKSGYVLDNNGAECKPLTEEEKKLYADKYCHTYLRKVTCSICQEGYLFEDNVNRCVACANQSSGCAYCDPLDSSKCLVCKTGKYIDSDFKCHDNKVQQVQSQTGVESVLSDFYRDFNLQSLLSLTLFNIFIMIIFN